MPYYRLSVKDGAPAPLVETTSLDGPLIVEASDEITARAIAKTNFWNILRDRDGMPRLECIWTDRTWVECKALSNFDEPANGSDLHKADMITCPDFDFLNGRFARLVSWSEDYDPASKPLDEATILPPDRHRRFAKAKRTRSQTARTPTLQ